MTVSTFRLLACGTLLALAFASVPAIGGGPDTDSDGVPDSADNCILVINPLQRDTDGDSFGNFCDGDFNQDGIVNLTDLGLMRLGFFAAPGDANYDPDLNMDGVGFVNFVDLNLLKAQYLLPPGPGAITALTDIQLNDTSVDENEPIGTPVGAFTSTDSPASDTHTDTLVPGVDDTGNAHFTITGAGLNTAAVLDFETTANCTTTASTCSIRVQTNDGNGGMYQESPIISINNVKEAPVAMHDRDSDQDSAFAALAQNVRSVQ